jgi:hypothetical protein
MAAFKCGHPKTPENSKPSGHSFTQCKLCQRVHNIVAKVVKGQENINAGRSVDGRHSRTRLWL